MFFGKDSSEILSLPWNEFQENIPLYMGFSEYNSTEELLKSLEEYIFNKCYNHDTVGLVFEALSKTFQHRVFIFEESLTNSPRGIVGKKCNLCINVLKRGDHYNLIVVNEKGCEKANNRLHNPYSCSILLFYVARRSGKITFFGTKYFFDAASSCFCRHEILFCATSARFCRNQIQ